MTDDPSIIFERAATRMVNNDLSAALDQYEAGIDRAEAAQRSEAQLAADFLALALKGDLSAVAEFAPRVYQHPNSMRDATLADVLQDALDHADHFERLYAFFVRRAREKDPDACELLARLAAGYGRRFAD